ncbi:hypothetical protein [Roseibium alexandrii]|uniref:hypothetical protein n=1 Tax=Roseibium alexandrii TaxID=388408 RepID=UPI0037524EC3
MGNRQNSRVAWVTPTAIGVASFFVVYLVTNAPAAKKQDRHPMMITEEGTHRR